MDQSALSLIALPWLHYMAVIFMVGAAVAELQLLGMAGTPDTLRTLVKVDRVYGIAAGLVLVTGILRFYFGGKGADWYWSNGLMHGLLGVFVLTAALSIPPTLRYLRWQRAHRQSGALPQASEVRRTKILVHVQLALIAVITLLITMIAKGYGAKETLPPALGS